MIYKNRLRLIGARILVGLTAALIPAIASAHVVVSPSQVGVGQELTFNLSVPNERDAAVTTVKLLVPAEIKDVSPTVVPGWQIQVDRDKAGNPSQIIWSGGMIPVGQREDFTFSSQAPAKITTLSWKAYQQYADGTMVSWDQQPTATETDDDSATVGPYSQTKVVNDLNSAPAKHDNLALGLAAAALALAALGFVESHRLWKQR